MKMYLKGTRKMGLFISIIVLVMIGFQVVYGVGAEPGSQDDPVITQSYLEEIVVPLIREDIDGKIAALTKRIDELAVQKPGQSGQPDKFMVVSVKPGQKLIGGAGTELILRMGKATIIATQKGGLADTTTGVDLQNGAPMPANHLLIVPVDDGRGFTANEDVLVMVKGTYTIQ
jgi:hypothetical protein